jgi:hypothetical protein
MDAVDELGSRGLIDWPRAVVNGIARQICRGHPRYQLGWLPRITWREAGDVLVVLLGGAVSGWALPPRLRHRPPRGTRLGVPFTLQLPDTVMIIVSAGA